MSAFWDAIDQQLEELKTAKTADDVLAILSPERMPDGDAEMCAGPAFFAGGGGDYTPADSLRGAGWTTLWYEAPYYYALRSPDGQSEISYVEGDVFPRDVKAGLRA